MTNHIQIPPISPRIQYTTNGSQTNFIYSFPIFNASQLHVFINGAEIVSGFVVLGVGSSTGGSVIFDTAPISGNTLTLERILPLQRISDFIEGGELSANALNNEFDYLTASLQQLEEEQSCYVGFPKTEQAANTELPASAARSNKTLGFDSNGEFALYETGSTYAAPSYAQSGTGAVARPITDKPKEFVSVKDFGAKGDGLTNDASAITNALAAHHTIYFPPGTYLLNSGLEIGDHKILRGSGPATILKAANNSMDTVAMIGKSSQINDLVIDGGDSALRLYGKTSPCTNNIVSNVIIRNINIGIELDGYINTTNICDGNSFHNIVIEKPTQYGVLVTRSGIGKQPNANKFNGVRVTSLGTSISGAGFFLESAKYNNALINCETYLTGTPIACIHIGSESDRTLVINAYCEALNLVPNILMANGSMESSLINLYSNSNGAAIEDNSGGNYIAFNAGFPNRTKLGRAIASDMTVAQQRYLFETVSFSSANTVVVNLSKSIYIINATNAVTTVQLPKAASGNSGAVITVKKTDNSTNGVLITENTGNGPDGRTFRLGSQHDVVSVISDGEVWRVLNSNLSTYNCKYVSGITPYVPDITQQVHAVSAISGLTVVELPPANNPASFGRHLTIKKIDSSANAVRITESGATGPDNAVVNLTAQYSAITVMSNGATWYTIAKV